MAHPSPFVSRFASPATLHTTPAAAPSAEATEDSEASKDVVHASPFVTRLTSHLDALTSLTVALSPDATEGPAASKDMAHDSPVVARLVFPVDALTSPAAGPPLEFLEATAAALSLEASTDLAEGPSPAASKDYKNATPARKKKARSDSIHKSAMKNIAAKVALEVLDP